MRGRRLEVDERLLDVAQSEFRRSVADFGSDPYQLLPHVEECEKWARYLLHCRPTADSQAVLLAVWLHDIGHYPIPTDVDHAVRSAARAEALLRTSGCDEALAGRVLHCVRAHRCKDVVPTTLEARILACADSASHMTDTMYFSMARDDKASNVSFRAYAKLKRDLEDIACFPEVASKLEELSAAWFRVLQAYDSLELLGTGNA